MRVPLIPLETVFHVGSLDVDDRGRRFAKGTSYEGDGLSVSLCPEAWERIARLGGSGHHRLDRAGAMFLDAHACVSDPSFADIVDWGRSETLIEEATSWRLWTYDDEQDIWRHFTFSSEEAARQEVEFEDDEGEAPEGHERIEPFSTLKALPRVRDISGMDLTDDDDATDALLMAFAKIRLPQIGIHVDGIWWNENYDPGALSAPRGCIFPDLVSKWAPSPAADVSDETRMERLPDVRWVSAPFVENQGDLKRHPSILEEAEAFCFARPELGSVEGSFDRCMEVSVALAKRYAGMGFDARIVRMVGAEVSFPEAHDKWRDLPRPSSWSHYAVGIGGLVIDCTMRQFDPAADFPLVSPVEEHERLWSTVDTWTIDRHEDPFHGIYDEELSVRTLGR